MLGREVRFLLAHSSVYGLGTVAAQFVSFLLLPLYTAYLSPAEYGVLSVVEVSSGILGVVLTVGMSRALSRFYFEEEDPAWRRRVVSTAFLTYAALAALAAPALIWLSRPSARLILGSAEHEALFMAGFSSLVLGGFLDLGLMYLRLLKRPGFFITLTLTRIVALVGLNVYFIVRMGLGPAGILYSSLIVSACYGAAILAVVLRRTGLAFSPALFRDLLAYGFPLVGSKLGNTLVKEADKYVVLYFLSTADLGIYSLAMKFGVGLHNLVTIPLNMAYIPRRFEIMRDPEAPRTFGSIFTYYILVMTVVGLVLSLFLPEILGVMVQERFRAAGRYIPAILLTMIVLGSHYHLDLGILYSKETKYYALTNVLGGVCQLVLAVALVWRAGLWGAVAASLGSYGLQAVLLYRFSRRAYPIDYEFRRVFGVLLLAVGAYGLSRLLPASGPLLSLALRTALVAAFLALVLRFFSTGQEREAVGHLVRRWSRRLAGSTPAG